MVSVSGLNTFFSKAYAGRSTSYDTYAPGAAAGTLDILLHRAKRNKAVTESKIWDYIRVENDPNFGRKKSEPKFSKLISRMSASASIVTVIASQVHMANVHEFIPENLRELLFNYSSLVDTGINLLDNFETQIIFSQIEQALFADLEIQFFGGTMTFNEIVNTVDKISALENIEELIKNEGLRPLLNLGIQNLLPNSMIGIFETIQFIDNLNTIFVDDEHNRVLFSDEVSAQIVVYGETGVSSSLTSPNDYLTQDINFGDSLGLIARDKFEGEVDSAYITEIERIVYLTGPKYSLSKEDMDSVIADLTVDAQENVGKALTGKVGLPSLVKITKGLSAQANNQTLSAIEGAFNQLIDKIISDAGIVPASTDSDAPSQLDYLSNVKTNIEKRLEFKKRGATSSEFKTIDKYLSTVIQSGIVTDESLEELNTALDILFKAPDVGS